MIRHSITSEPGRIGISIPIFAGSVRASAFPFAVNAFLPLDRREALRFSARLHRGKHVMLMLILGRHLLRTGPDGTWWYDDTVTWVTGLLALVWLTWFFVRRYLRARALKRRPRRINHRLRRTVRIKRELSSQYLRPGFSGNIHAVGIGRIGGDDYCIQVFLNDLDDELWQGSGAETLPNSYRGVPIIPVEAPSASLLSAEVTRPLEILDKYPRGIRGPQE